MLHLLHCNCSVVPRTKRKKNRKFNLKHGRPDFFAIFSLKSKRVYVREQDRAPNSHNRATLANRALFRDTTGRQQCRSTRIDLSTTKTKRWTPNKLNSDSFIKPKIKNSKKKATNLCDCFEHNHHQLHHYKGCFELGNRWHRRYEEKKKTKSRQCLVDFRLPFALQSIDGAYILCNRRFGARFVFHHAVSFKVQTIIVVCVGRWAKRRGHTSHLERRRTGGEPVPRNGTRQPSLRKAWIFFFIFTNFTSIKTQTRSGNNDHHIAQRQNSKTEQNERENKTQNEKNAPKNSKKKKKEKQSNEKQTKQNTIPLTMQVGKGLGWKEKKN